MSYAFALSGKVTVGPPPATDPASGDFSFKAPLEEAILLDGKQVTTVSLGDDAAESVSIGDLPSAHVVLVRVLTTGVGKVLVALTHADGADQVVPADPLVLVLSYASPVTALTLQRSPGVAATVEVLFGHVA